MVGAMSPGCCSALRKFDQPFRFNCLTNSAQYLPSSFCNSSKPAFVRECWVWSVVVWCCAGFALWCCTRYANGSILRLGRRCELWLTFNVGVLWVHDRFGRGSGGCGSGETVRFTLPDRQGGRTPAALRLARVSTTQFERNALSVVVKGRSWSAFRLQLAKQSPLRW
jgi:uncharacterized membrane protein YbhN (UPF0104 family)